VLLKHPQSPAWLTFDCSLAQKKISVSFGGKVNVCKLVKLGNEDTFLSLCNEHESESGK